MTARSAVIGLALVASLLAGLLLVSQRSCTPSRLATERKGRLLTGFDFDAVTRLTIQRPSDTLTLARNARGWRMLQPSAAAANSDRVASLLGQLDWAEPRRTLQDIKPEDRGRFGLAQSKVVLHIHSGHRNQTLRIGHQEPLAGGRYAEIDGDPSIYVIAKDLWEALTAPAADYAATQAVDGAAAVDPTAESS